MMNFAVRIGQVCDGLKNFGYVWLDFTGGLHVHIALDQLATLPTASVAVFGHGQFIQALRWWIAESPAALDADAMRAFRAFDLAHPIANGGGFTDVHHGRTWSLA